MSRILKPMRIVRLVLEHFIPSFIIGAVVYFFYKKDIFLFFLPILTGSFIDSDHLLDYLLAWRNNFWKGISLKSCATGEYFVKNRKIIVLLHSWELVFLWILFWMLMRKTDVALIGAFSWVVHLIIDQLSYNLHPASYFLLYRISKKFNITAICRDVVDGESCEIEKLGR